MMVDHKKHSTISAGAIGFLASIVLSTILILLIPIGILKEMFDMATAGFLVVAVQFISSFVGSYIAGKRRKENPAAAIGGGIGAYLVLLLCAGLLFFEGLSNSLLPGILAVISGAVLGFFLVIRKKDTGKRRKRHHRAR